MQRPKAWCAYGCAAAAALCCDPSKGWAQSPVNQPPLYLGQTSFLDGEGAPGFTFETIGVESFAGYATDASGRAVPGTNKQWTAGVTLHPIYVTGTKLLGGNLGFELLLPFAVTHLQMPDSPGSTQGGVGDLVIGPTLQWSGGSLLGKPFSSRLGLQGLLPSGSYTASRTINAGSNVWQIAPYYAFTWKPFERWEFSTRLIYDWSSANHDPPPRLNTTSVQPGSQFAVNYGVSYAVSPGLRLGLAGYALKQLSDTKVGGKGVDRSRQQVFAVGPGLLWKAGKATVIANVFREFASENRPEGFNVIARLLYSF